MLFYFSIHCMYQYLQFLPQYHFHEGSVPSFQHALSNQQFLPIRPFCFLSTFTYSLLLLMAHLSW